MIFDYLAKLVRPECPACDGVGGFMTGEYQPELSNCGCCDPTGDNMNDEQTRVWRWHWWIFRFRVWREARRLDKWIDRQGDDICAACGAARREHAPGGIRDPSKNTLCGIFIPRGSV